jgi:AAA domain-containing protein
VRKRVRAWEDHAGTRLKVKFLPVPVQFAQALDRVAVAEVASEMGAALVVIDTQARCTVGLEENSSKDMGLFIDAVEYVREATRACILIVHHEGRLGEHGRGSSAMDGAVITEWRLERDGRTLILSNPKQKDAEEEPPVTLTLEVAGDSCLIKPGRRVVYTESQHQILAALKDIFPEGGASSAELGVATGLGKTTVWRSIKGLLDARLIVNTGTGKRPYYQLQERSTGGA